MNPHLDGKPRVGLTIAIPYSGRPTTVEWGLSMAVQGWPMNLDIYFSAVKGKPVDEARTILVEKALANNSKYLFFLDDDVILPLNAGRKLYDSLITADEKTMICAGIYSNRDTDHPEPMIFQDNGAGPFWKWKVGDVFPIKGAGTGAMMIKTEVFEKIEKPWFKIIDQLTYYEGEGYLNDYMTDDLYFCKKVIDAGFGIIADGAVICAHQNATTGKTYYLPSQSYPFQQ